MEIKINLQGREVAKSVVNNTAVAVGEPMQEIYSDEIKDIFSDINSLIGLSKVKSVIYEIYAFKEIQKKRQKEQLKTLPTVLHAIFRGNPGSGKTTVARLLGSLYKEMGVISKGHLVEVERADLVGEFIGHTAQKTRENLKKAQGGVLFIDEAYSLCRGGEKDFGREAIDALVKAMEDRKNDFVLILAGYPKEMEMFLRSNPGLSSRFPLHIDFPDYTIDELIAIAEVMYKEHQYNPDLSAFDELKQFLINSNNASYTAQGNARTIRNIVEASLRAQAIRLVNHANPNISDLQLIMANDIRYAIKQLPPVSPNKNKERSTLYPFT